MKIRDARIIQKLPMRSGSGKSGMWYQQTYVVEYTSRGGYNVTLAVEAQGEKNVQDFNRFNVGDVVDIRLNLSSRCWDGRWYTTASCWMMTIAQQHEQQRMRADNDFPDDF